MINRLRIEFDDKNQNRWMRNGILPEFLVALVGVGILGVEGGMPLLGHTLAAELVARKTGGVGILQRRPNFNHLIPLEHNCDFTDDF